MASGLSDVSRRVPRTSVRVSFTPSHGDIAARSATLPFIEEESDIADIRTGAIKKGDSPVALKSDSQEIETIALSGLCVSRRYGPTCRRADGDSST